MTGTRRRMAWVILTLLVLPGIAMDARADHQGVDNHICSTWNSTAGICDDYNFADDRTNAMEWIEGRYHVQMANATKMAVTMEWAVHEVRRDDVWLEDLPLGNGSDAATDGIPADYLRNYLDYITLSGMSVREALRSSVSSTVESMVDNGFGSTSSVQTLYTDSVTIEDTDIQCTDDADEDSAGEVSGLPNDAYNPPLCLRTTLTIDVDPSELGLTDAGLDVERAYQGLLTMGAEVSTNISLSALPGHYASYEFIPPNYGTLSGVGTGGEAIPSSPPDHVYGRWALDHLDASDASWLNTTSSVTMARKSTVTKAVELNLSSDRGLGIELVVDARDERATSVEVILAFHHVGVSTLEDWDWSIGDDRIDLPWVTADGLRLAHHTGIANLSDLAEKVPVDDLNQMALDHSPTPVSFSNFAFAPANGTGGLDFTHRPGVTCAESAPSHWCTQGSNAMNGTHPVYLVSRSNTFDLDVGAMASTLADDFGVDLMGFDPGILTQTDRAVILNALTAHGELDTGILTSWMDDDLPPADVTVTVMLPEYVRSATGAPGLLTLRHTSGETALQEISLTGAEPYDWQHPICRDRGSCHGDEIDLVCAADQRTCLAVDVEVDLQELDIHEWSQTIEMVAETRIDVRLYRLAVPASALENQTHIEIDVIPADLIRHAVALGDRMEGGLASPFEDDLRFRFDDELIPLVLDRQGLQTFTGDIGEVMQDRINTEMADMTEEINAGEDLKLEVSEIDVSASLSGLDLPPGTALDDRRPIEISIDVSRMRVKAQYTGEDLQLTAAMQAWTGAMLRATALSPPVAAQGEISGIELPQGEDVTQEIIPPSFEAEGELVTPSVRLKLTFPRGLGFSVFNSDLNRAELTESGGRQTLTYHLPLCTADTVAGCDSQGDTVRFRMVIGVEYILGQIAVYLGGLLGLILLLAFLRIRRKRNKRQALLDEETERLRKLRVREADILESENYGEDGLPDMGMMPGLDEAGDIPAESWEDDFSF